MSVMVIVLGVIAVTIAVSVGLVLAARHFLKLREKLAPEVVYPAAGETESSFAAPRRAALYREAA